MLNVRNTGQQFWRLSGVYSDLGEGEFVGRHIAPEKNDGTPIGHRRRLLFIDPLVRKLRSGSYLLLISQTSYGNNKNTIRPSIRMLSAINDH